MILRSVAVSFGLLVAACGGKQGPGAGSDAGPGTDAGSTKDGSRTETGTANDAASGPSCQANANSNPACTGCVQGKCSNQVSAVESACGAYLSCFCACALGDAACYTGCAPLESSACMSATMLINTCETNTCQSECVAVTPTDAGSGGTATGTCAALLTCCMSAGSNAAACEQSVASLDDDQAGCSAALAGYQDAGVCH